MNLGLDDKVIVVTGGAAGIGLASVKLLAAESATVVMADLSEERLQTESENLSAGGFSVLPIAVDVSSAGSVEAMTAAVLDRYGTIDILVNNAGIGLFKGVEEESFEEWTRMLNVNLTGVQLCSASVFSIMKKNGGGKIINMGSLGGQVGGMRTSPGYVASKAGVMGLTKSYARHGARWGITANSVSPGLIETDMARGLYSPDATLLGRLGKPEDVAKVVLFLASHLSDYLTGTTIDVNGGVLLR